VQAAPIDSNQPINGPPIEKREDKAGPVAHLEEPSVEPDKQPQPLRSLSIEFTPDGAQEVRLRMSERAGDVHISLHSSDPSLSGRLSEGVHELVGSLANAGYEAEAWTQNQGRQNQRQNEDPRKSRRNQATGSEAEDFSGVMRQA
jgi:hypothetical protein